MVKQTNSACAMRSGRGGVGVGAVVVVVVEDDDDDDAMMRDVVVANGGKL